MTATFPHLRNLLAALVALAAVSVFAGSVSAQATPAITAMPSTTPDSYVVSGSGFVPGTQLYVNEIPCGALPCGSGPQPGRQEVTVGSNGTFIVSMQLQTGENLGRGYRLIAAYGFEWTRDQIIAAPTVRVAESHPGTGVAQTPVPPATGSGSATAGQESTSLWPFLAASAAAIAGGWILFSLRARRPLRR